jgi:hypothetical protein
MWFALPTAYFFLALGAHAVVARVRPAGGRVPQFVAVGGLGGILLTLHLLAGSNVHWTGSLAGILAYAFACELYIFLFTFVISSVSVALLVTRGRPVTAEKSAQPLNATGMVEQRLRMLTQRGLLDAQEGRYRLNDRSRFMVGIYRRLRQFFCHDGS